MIRSTPTPNPDAYLFQVQETLIPSGTYEFFHDQDLTASPLAKEILEIEGLELLMIAPRFITVRKFSDESWDELLPEITSVFEQFLQSGQMVVVESQQNQREQANMMLSVRSWIFFKRKFDRPSPKMEEILSTTGLRMALLNLNSLVPAEPALRLHKLFMWASKIT